MARRLGALLCLGVILWAPACRQADDKRLNILLISIDTLRADHLSCYGYERRTSPYLDAFAAEGALFRRAYSHVAWTLPSHMSLLTSMYPAAHGVKEDQALSPDVVTLPELLQRSGYHVIGLHNNSWLDERFGFGRGFDLYQRHDDGSGLRRKVGSLLEQLAGNRERPFFILLHTNAVHSGPLDQAGVPVYDSPVEYRDAFLPHPDRNTTRYLAEDIFYDRVKLTSEQAANVVAQYDGGILYVDSFLNGMFEQMKSLGLYKNTLIIVTSDHGEALGDHGSYRGHGRFWENGIHVPLLVKLPDSDARRSEWTGVEFDSVVQLVDIAPGIARMAGLRTPATFQGHDFTALRAHPVIASRGASAVLIQGQYKLWVQSLAKRQVLLHKLSEDPDEAHSLHEELPGMVNSMGRKLFDSLVRQKELHRKMSDAERDRVDLGSETYNELRALGYLNGR